MSDYDHCEVYAICGFEVELEARTLDIEHACSDTLSIRGRMLTVEQV